MDKRIGFLASAKKILGGKEVVSRTELIGVTEKLGDVFPQWLTKDENNKAGRGMYKMPYHLIGGDSSMVTSIKASKKIIEQAITKAVTGVEEIPEISNTPTVNVIIDSGIDDPNDIPEIDHTNGSGMISAGVSLKIIDNLHDAMGNSVNYVPKIKPTYVAWGHHEDIKEAIASKRFFTALITGLSGNGKTLMVQQICAELGREFIRVQITKETTEDDLIGGFRLVGGETVWQDGPVVEAMLRGAVLLLDEMCQNNRLMVLQPVLEGEPLFIKKLNRTIERSEGFMVIGTSNTKGRGDSTGMFVGEEPMNEAFLERFRINFEQAYPEIDTEMLILNRYFEVNSYAPPTTFVKVLSEWAVNIRKAYAAGGIGDVITTRRLIFIAEAFMIYKDEKKAMDRVLSRFDHDVKKAMMAVYDKMVAVHGAVDPSPVESVSSSTTEKLEDIPF